MCKYINGLSDTNFEMFVHYDLSILLEDSQYLSTFTKVPGSG